MPRPQQFSAPQMLTAAQIEVAFYQGSGEHKVERWWNGRPLAKIRKDGTLKRPKKQLTTPCPKVTVAERDEATLWVQGALRAGHMRFCEGDTVYPRYVWYRDSDGQYWIGRVINRDLGDYKGWPISEAEKNEAFD